MASESPDCLERSFNAPIICHIYNGHSVHGFSASSTPIRLGKLATTRRAASLSYLSRQNLVYPALDKVQLDRFIDTQICEIIHSPVATPKSIYLILALRYQLGNALHMQELSPRLYDARRILQYYSIGTNTIFCGRINLFKSENLVLKTAYSIEYRIQDLIKLVEYEVGESLRTPKSMSDPATVSCALWILYLSIRSHHKVHW